MDILNNDAWWRDLKFSDFLTNIAQYMRLGPMLARERFVHIHHILTHISVKVRLQSPEGIDAASFLYQSLQAYDFLHLFQTKKCQLQVVYFCSLLIFSRLVALINGEISLLESTCVKNLPRVRTRKVQILSCPWSRHAD